MEAVRKITHNNKEILILDYSNSRGTRLTEIFRAAKQLALTDNQPVPVLSIFNDKTYVNREFLNHLRAEMEEVDHLIEKQAIVGLTKVQEWILMGMNIWYKRQIHKFASLDEALEFLSRQPS